MSSSGRSRRRWNVDFSCAGCGHLFVYFRNWSNARPPYQEEAAWQGIHESVYRDLLVAFGDWGFEPMELADPYPWNKEGTSAGASGSSSAVHLWQGGEDRILDPEVQRYVAISRVLDCGHLLVHKQVWSNAILRELILELKEEHDQAKPSAGAAAAA